MYVEFEVLTAAVRNVAIYWDTAPCTPYANRRLGVTYHLHLQGRKSAEQETSLKQAVRQNFRNFPNETLCMCTDTKSRNETKLSLMFTITSCFVTVDADIILERSNEPSYMNPMNYQFGLGFLHSLFRSLNLTT
jgi:hypothetical protein